MNNVTFGEFLKQIMTERKISAAKLAELTGIKSKTTVVRLINNQSSQKSVEQFANKLSDIIELTHEEQKKLDGVLNSISVSPVEKKVMENLKLLFYDVPNAFSGSICTAYNAEENGEKIPLHNIFSICKNKESMIIIEDVISVELVFALNDLIHSTTKDDAAPIINHFFKTDDGMEAKGMQLLSIMKLSTYLGYSAFECKRGCALSKKIFILTKNDNSYHMRLVQFINIDKFYYVDTEITEILYKHILYEKNIYINNSVPLRSEPINKNRLDEMIEALKEYDKLPSLQINSSISYMMIPFNIQCRLFEKCNYIGMGKEHPYIKKLYSLLEKRAKFLATCGIPRKFIWTKPGLKSFIKTGKAGDHFNPLSALTYDECVQTLKYITSNKGTQYRILKDEYRVIDTEFVLCPDKGVVIYDPIWGWWDGFTSADITDKRMVKLLANFYNNELWEKNCYSDEESKEIIKKLLMRK